MSELIKRLAWLVALVAVIFAGAWFSREWLDQKRHPEKQLEMAMMEKRLGLSEQMTPENRQLIERCLEKDPYGALVVASTDTDRFAALKDWLANGTVTPEMEIEQMAVRAAREGQLDSTTAASFAQSSGEIVDFLKDIDPHSSSTILASLHHLSADEYRNVALDSSYMQIAGMLAPAERETFRNYQADLTPILATASPTGWNALVKAFEAAQPRVSQLMNDKQKGLIYAEIYMLNLDAIRQMVAAGIDETEAIEFVGINASELKRIQKSDPGWVGRIARMKQVTVDANGKAPDRTVYAWSLIDPATFYLVAHDNSPDQKNSLAVLTWYAGTNLPQILLTSYNKDDQTLNNAIAAVRNYEFDDSNKRIQAGAKFIGNYKDNDVFKACLFKHGPRLIPALSAGGEELLSSIYSNPNNIDGWVTSDGKAIDRHPWWIWVPGGTVAFAINEKVHGRNLTNSETFWTVVDGVTVVFVVDSIGESVVRIAGETAVKDAAVAEGKTVATAIEREAAEASLAGSTTTFLKLAGYAVVESGVEIAKSVAAAAIRSPVRTIVIGLGVYAALHPEIAVAILNKIASGAGHVIATLPEQVVKGILDGVGSGLGQPAWLQKLYWPLVILIYLLAFVVFMLFVRRLFREAYDLFVRPVTTLVKMLWRLLTARRARPTTIKAE